MTNLERRYTSWISPVGLLALALAGACTDGGETDTEATDSAFVITYEDAIAWGDQTATGEVRAVLVTHDAARDLLALLRVSAGGGSWEDADGNSRELVLDPAAVGDEGVTVLGRLPSTPEEGAIELYSIWTLHTADVSYDGCKPVRTDTPCEQSGGSTCCQYARFCDDGSYNVYWDCYPNSGGGGDHDCSTKL